jgi:hypothetical protein
VVGAGAGSSVLVWDPPRTSSCLSRARAGLGDITGPIADVQLMGYAMPQQTAQGLHTRLFARSFVMADPSEPRCARTAVARETEEPQRLACCTAHAHAKAAQPGVAEAGVAEARTKRSVAFHRLPLCEPHRPKVRLYTPPRPGLPRSPRGALHPLGRQPNAVTPSTTPISRTTSASPPGPAFRRRTRPSPRPAPPAPPPTALRSRRLVYVSLDACMASQLLTLRVVQALQAEHPGLYSAANVALSGTHTHASPAGRRACGVRPTRHMLPRHMLPARPTACLHALVGRQPLCRGCRAVGVWR